MLLWMKKKSKNILSKSSIVNESIRTILNLFYFIFLREDYTRTKKHKKHKNYKALKRKKHKNCKKHNTPNKRLSSS